MQDIGSMPHTEGSLSLPLATKISTEMYGRVLIMDDDMFMRSMAVDMLSALGFFSRAARNGEEAIAIYRHTQRMGEAFDAVILDIHIKGGLGGGDTMKHLLDMDPGLNAIVSSSDETSPLMRAYRDYGFKARLPKPYSMRQMFQALITAINTSPDVPLQSFPFPSAGGQTK